MINRKSRNLVVLIATYDRIELLQRSIDAISRGTRCSHEIIVIDGGSTDGTVEFLKANKSVTAVFQGELLGTAQCYNEVWREIDSQYTCWLSDDTHIVPGSLDTATTILDHDRDIGMVGLKMKDTVGPRAVEPYVGGLSEYGILNCNHGVLPTALLRAIGYFNEAYRSYMIDPDLTASVLCTGRKVVMTKKVSVLHHREWAEELSIQAKTAQDTGGIDNAAVYREKFRFLATMPGLGVQTKSLMGAVIGRLAFMKSKPETVRWGHSRRDWTNLMNGRFIRFLDTIEHRSKPYHLAQKIPRGLCESVDNPYQHLACSSRRVL